MLNSSSISLLLPFRSPTPTLFFQQTRQWNNTPVKVCLSMVQLEEGMKIQRTSYWQITSLLFTCGVYISIPFPSLLASSFIEPKIPKGKDKIWLQFKLGWNDMISKLTMCGVTEAQFLLLMPLNFSGIFIWESFVYYSFAPPPGKRQKLLRRFT